MQIAFQKNFLPRSQYYASLVLSRQLKVKDRYGQLLPVIFIAIVDQVPTCMNTECKKEWTRRFIKNNFTNVFVEKKLKKHVEQILFDKERAYMPYTQEEIAKRMTIKKKREEIVSIRQKINQLSRNISDIETEIRLLNYGKDMVVEKNVNKFLLACPSEGCKGFISHNKCGICDKKICKECREIMVDDEHKCDPSTVETIKLLKRDTKPCPRCASMIYKIDGCDQMFCTQCHIAFSWNTGREEKTIHNPHYYEMMRRTKGFVPRNPLDVPRCNRRELGHEDAAMIKYTYSRINPVFSEEIQRYIRSDVHNNANFTVKYQPDNENNHMNNLEKRVEYMSNNITDEQFKTYIQRKAKAKAKDKEIFDVLTLMSTALSDIILRFIQIAQHSTMSRNDIQEEMKKTMIEIQNITKYCNDLLIEISETYNSVAYYYNKDLEFVSVNEKKKK